MKSVPFSLLLSWVALGQTCPIEPPDLPPVGMANAKHTCACDGSSLNCHWTWVAGGTTSPPQVNPIDPGLLNALANPHPASTAVPPDASRKCIGMNATFGTPVDACMAIERRKAESAQAKLQGSIQRVVASLQLAGIHHPDFQAVYQSHPNLFDPSPAMEKAITDSKNPGEVVYYLETHAEQYYRIASLKDRDQKREIGKIDKLTNTK